MVFKKIYKNKSNLNFQEILILYYSKRNGSQNFCGYVTVLVFNLSIFYLVIEMIFF